MLARRSLLASLCLLALSLTAQNLGDLTGSVVEMLGNRVPGVSVLLTPDGWQGKSFQVIANSDGGYRFWDVPPGEYRLNLKSPGFSSLNVKFTRAASGPQLLPPVELQIGLSADCGGHPVLDYIHFIQPGKRTGTVSGSVRSEGDDRPLAGTAVALACSKCSKTVTDKNGDFVFSEMIPGNYSIRVEKPGYHPLTWPVTAMSPQFRVMEGVESVYYPMYLEPCAEASCDPFLRPEKLLAICE